MEDTSKGLRVTTVVLDEDTLDINNDTYSDKTVYDVFKNDNLSNVPLEYLFQMKKHLTNVYREKLLASGKQRVCYYLDEDCKGTPAFATREEAIHYVTLHVLSNGVEGTQKVVFNEKGVYTVKYHHKDYDRTVYARVYFGWVD